MGCRRYRPFHRADLGRVIAMLPLIRNWFRQFGLSIPTMARRILEWLTCRLYGRWRVLTIATDVDKIPCRISHRRAYLVATSTMNKWLVFDCPCRTGHRLLINLDATRPPYWSIKLSTSQLITLSPSIDYRVGSQRCHFVFRKGRIRWTNRHT